MKRLLIFIIVLLFSSCASVNKDIVKPPIYFKNWCVTCGNKAWIPCDNCWNGKMLDGSICPKCNGRGKLLCPECFGKCNPNAEWR